MLKNIISIAALTATMMACSSKGNFTCECTSTSSRINDGVASPASTSSTTTKKVYVEQYKKAAENDCATYSRTRTDVNGTTGVDDAPVDSDTQVQTCKLTSN